MTIKQVEDQLTDLVHRDPFVPLVIELLDGQSLIVPDAPAFDSTGAGFIGTDGALVEFEFKNVQAIRLYVPEAAA